MSEESFEDVSSRNALIKRIAEISPDMVTISPVCESLHKLNILKSMKLGNNHAPRQSAHPVFEGEISVLASRVQRHISLCEFVIKHQQSQGRYFDVSFPVQFEQCITRATDRMSNTEGATTTTCNQLGKQCKHITNRRL